MQLTTLDWVVIAAYFLVNLAIGFYYYRKASGSVGEFFISGRSVPWWLAGTSMVATTFGADTPLVVTGLVYKYGIAGNWFWWSFALSGMMTVFFFARLWRRAGVLTDMEFAELRYSGKPAAFLRGFRALYLALPVNTIIMGWVNLAMVKILELTLGVTKPQAIAITLAIAAFILLYATTSGLWSVLWTDVIQFILKMFVVIALAIFSVKAIGGMTVLAEKLNAHDAAMANGVNTLAFVPDWTSSWFIMFLVFLSLNWWASWYPGAEPGGGGYIAQRIFSAKDEKNSLAATLWFNIAHYAVRPWPWILTALVAVVMFPHMKDPEGGYIQVMIVDLPASLRGLMLAGFAAAYMSTMATHINLGASYMINDFYRRFLKRDGSEGHYVAASRVATVLVTLLAAVASLYMQSIEGAWKFLMSIGAGAGLVFMLRWFWWRINAWSEIGAMAMAGCSSLFLQSAWAMPVVNLFRNIDPKLSAAPLDANDPHGFAWLMIITTSLTTITWLVVTMFTPPEPEAKLRSFYQKVQPSRLGWGPIAALESVHSKQSLAWSTADWIAGCGLIYCSLFSVGHLIFGRPLQAGILFVIGVICAWFIYWDLNRRGWETLSQ
jgi:SSS family solute:Na+ symporter